MKNSHTFRIAFGFRVIGLAWLLLGLQSCSPVLQLPVTHGIPMLSNQGEVECSGNFAVTGLNLDGAYALTDHYFIGGNYNTLFSLYNTYYGNNTAMYELNGGYYTKTSETGRFELQVGAGFGNTSGSSIYYTEDEASPYWTCNYSTNMNYFFLQPSVAKVGKIGEIGFGLRLEYMYFPNFYSQIQEYYGDPNSPNPPPTILYNMPDEFSIEPIFYWAVGYDIVKFKMQAGLLISPGGEGFFTPFDTYQNGYVGIGLQVRLFNNWNEEKLIKESKKKPKEKTEYKFQF